MWRRTLLGHVQAAALGYNGHFANGLTALFIACGQDVANVANSAVGITSFEVEPDGALYASVTLHALSVATVGGGTALGTSRECLAACSAAREDAEGGAAKLAEIAAATLLAGELSMGAAIAAGELAAAHEASAATGRKAEWGCPRRAHLGGEGVGRGAWSRRFDAATAAPLHWPAARELAIHHRRDGMVVTKRTAARR